MPHAPNSSFSLAIENLRGLYRSGRMRPADVIASVYDRITASGDDKVWISLTPREQAMASAQALEGRNIEDLPLYGIPFAVKDNIDVAGLPTTAACPEYAYEPDQSAFAVARAVQAGAIVVGKTNLDQFATGLVGVRSPYGVPRNPFDTSFVPGGSSSGSAVAVAAGLVSFAFGTDTAGSGRVPAGFNNIVGLKPSIGLVSAKGVVPACFSLDCVSIFSLTVPDAMAVLNAIQGPDPDYAYSRSAPAGYKSVVSATPEQFRFGVPAAAALKFFDDSKAQMAFDIARRRLEAMGGIASEIDFAPFAEAQAMLYSPAGAAERTAALAEFLNTSPDAIYPVTLGILRSGLSASAADLHNMIHRLQALKTAAVRAMSELDFLLVPTSGTIYKVADVESNPLALNANLGYYTNFVNYFDMSAIAIPNVMRDDGLPSGVTMIAPAFHEPLLAGFASRFHAATGLTLGATGHALVPSSTPIPASSAPRMDLAFFGAHMTGQPLNRDLVSLGGRKIGPCKTAPAYRAYALNGLPARPGLIRQKEFGSSFAGEIWSLPSASVGALLASIAPPLGLGTVLLADGRQIRGFICEGSAAAEAEDITAHGSWPEYLRARRQ